MAKSRELTFAVEVAAPVSLALYILTKWSVFLWAFNSLAVFTVIMHVLMVLFISTQVKKYVQLYAAAQKMQEKFTTKRLAFATLYNVTVILFLIHAELWKTLTLFSFSLLLFTMFISKLMSLKKLDEASTRKMLEAENARAKKLLRSR